MTQIVCVSTDFAESHQRCPQGLLVCLPNGDELTKLKNLQATATLVLATFAAIRARERLGLPLAHI